jgi:hypothetical protein
MHTHAPAHTYICVLYIYIYTHLIKWPAMPTHVHLPTGNAVYQCISLSAPMEPLKALLPQPPAPIQMGRRALWKDSIEFLEQKSDSYQNCDVPLLTSDEDYICSPLYPLGVLYDCDVGMTAFSNGNPGYHLKLRGLIFLFIAFMYSLLSLLMPWQQAISNQVSSAFVCWKARGRISKLCTYLCAGKHITHSWRWRINRIETYWVNIFYKKSSLFCALDALFTQFLPVLAVGFRILYWLPQL